MADVKLSDVKAGDTIEIDGGFECRGASSVVVEANADGDLYFVCAMGKHYLEGQCDGAGDILAGIIGHTPKVAA